MAKTKFLFLSGDGRCRIRTGPGPMGLDQIVVPIAPQIWESLEQAHDYYVFSVSVLGFGKLISLPELLEGVGSGCPRFHELGPRDTLADAVLVPEDQLSDLYLLLIGPADYRVARTRRLVAEGLGIRARGRVCVAKRPGDLVERIVVSQ